MKKMSAAMLKVKMRELIPSATEKLLRKKDAASLLACSNRTIDRLVNSGLLTRVKILGAVRFRLTEVLGIIKGGLT